MAAPPLRSRRAVSILLALILGIAGACAGSPPEVPDGPDGTPDPVLVTGREVFGAQCTSCHGTNGGGDRGPDVRAASMLDAYPDIADQIGVVADGRGGMPAFGAALTADEIDAVVRYTREVLD